ncbi:hypothetical protein RI129_010391 [Pyrocoelia pectoralis]|uniref:Cytochrome b5-related protein n=1 Tax=Pyrocoelia pectoralis TaxID=417401 RepID=A0AAN7V938_9COLE
MQVDSGKPQLSLSSKYPTNFEGIGNGKQWLNSKSADDETEGLWRVHDKLYDVTSFIQSHPGGPSWLELTKGTDITEAFEVHHLSSTPEQILKKYYVRKAQTPRNSPFTFKDDGFYRTLKRNVQGVLRDIPKDSGKFTDVTIDLMLVGTFFFAIFASAFGSLISGIVSAFLLTFTTIAAHNYFHRRDNFRMYYFNLSLMDFREWRISHSLSHHLFPNTIYDMEVTNLASYTPYLPIKKSTFFKCTSPVIAIIFWVSLYLLTYVKRMLAMVKTREAHLSDLVPFTLPLAMLLLSGVTPMAVLKMWLFIVTMASFIFGAIAFNAAHHHPDIFHEGDAPRSAQVDWAIHQLDAVADRHEITHNAFLVLTNFGDHALHHLFPTLDHSTLNYLYPIFKKTLKEFNLEHNVKSQIDMVFGQFQQLKRETPNTVPPGRGV